MTGRDSAGLLDRYIFIIAAAAAAAAKSLQSCPTLSDPMDCSPPGPLSMGFSRQEYWTGVPLPSLFIIEDTIKLHSREVHQ